MSDEAAAATPRPWDADGGDISQHWTRPEPWLDIVDSSVSCSSYCYGGSSAGVVREADAEFIVAVCGAYDAMSSELRQARAALDAVKGLPEKRSPERWVDLQQRDFEVGYNAALREVRAAIAAHTEGSDRGNAA